MVTVPTRRRSLQREILALSALAVRTREVHRETIARYNCAVRHLAKIAIVFLLAALVAGFEWDGRLSRLRRELGHEDPTRRRDVVRMLSGHPAERVSELVLEAMNDPEPIVRVEAAEAAGRLRLRAAVSPLLDWMNDPEPRARLAAGRALGRIGDPRALASLTRALGDTDAAVRRGAVEALGTIASTTPLVAIIGRLDDVDATVRVAAAEALARIGDGQAVLPLLGKVTDDSVEVRTSVYRALAELGDPRAVPALLHAMQSGPEEARVAAVAALGRLRDPAAIAELERSLDPTEPRRARAIIAALGRIEEPRALAAILETLAHPELRGTALETLVHAARRARLGGRTDLVRAIGDGSVAALGTAATAPQATALAQLLTRLLEEGTIEEAPPELVPIVLRRLREKMGAVETLLETLAISGAASALLPLVEHLESPDPSIRSASLHSLVRFAERHPLDGRAADPLLVALATVPKGQRVTVVRLLGPLGEPRALPTLRPLLGADDLELRRATVRAIGAIGDPTGALDLLPLLGDEDARTRFETAHALAHSADPKLVASLLAEVTRPTAVDRHATLIALGGVLRTLHRKRRLEEEPRRLARETLLAVVRDADRQDDPALASRALSALARWGDPRIAAPLLATASRLSSRLRRQVPKVLSAVGGPAAVEGLRRLLDDRDRAVATGAAGGLGEVGGSREAALLLPIVVAGRWPTSAAASFSLARLARHGALSARITPDLCAALSTRDPIVRANLAVALTALRATCAEGPSPADWLAPAHHSVVRGAAIRWLAATSSGSPEALERCAASELTPELAPVCRRPTLPPLSAEVDVYAYAADGKTLREDALLALRMSDGSVLLAYTDANGHLGLDRAPRGDLSLDDPVNFPFDP